MPLADIALRSGIVESDLILRYCTTKSGETVAAPHAGFSLLRRCRHVLSEALRVERARDAMARGAMDEMGALMDASHASCRDDYEVSCGELEKLVAHARRGGALGSRLTGAGFGGCTVSLVREADAEAFLAHLRSAFYDVREKALHASGLRLDEALFVARAVDGAGRIAAEQRSAERA
jgi:galactokinase